MTNVSMNVNGKPVSADVEVGLKAAVADRIAAGDVRVREVRHPVRTHAL